MYGSQLYSNHQKTLHVIAIVSSGSPHNACIAFCVVSETKPCIVSASHRNQTAASRPPSHGNQTTSGRPSVQIFRTGGRPAAVFRVMQKMMQKIYGRVQPYANARSVLPRIKKTASGGASTVRRSPEPRIKTS